MPEKIDAVLKPKLTAAIRKKVKLEVLEKAEFLTNEDWQSIIDKVWRFGLPRPDLAKYDDRFEEFIIRNKLVPIAKEAILKAKKWPRPDGGMLVEFRHIHQNDNIYILNDAQYKQFQNEFSKEIQAGLNNAREIKF